MNAATSPSRLARLQAENMELRSRLEEAEEALRAIREGEVDAIIVSGSQGDRVFSLMETENLHRLMVETMNEAGLAISPDGLLLYCNERAADLLQYPRHTLLGRRLDEFVVPQDAERLRLLLEVAHQATADDRVEFRAADGSAVPLHLWASQLDRPDEPIVCLVGTDLSRIEADRALVAQLGSQQRALLESRAEALELMAQAVLAREEAAQAARELIESDQRKDTFLATLAHELRNPLAAIHNALGILNLTGLDDPTAVEAREIIARQFTHLARLVDDLLEVSRITRGKIDLRREPILLDHVIESAVETVRPLIESSHQRLEVSLPPGPLWLEADPVRLNQVFGNLLNNACKFTKPGGTIQIEARIEPDGIRVSVRDTGIGIPTDLLPRVFDLFQQGDPTRSPIQGGLGIGLSLVKNLVEHHGGHVQAQSAGPEQGSEFVVRLPLMSTPPPAPEPTAPPLSAVLSAPCRILVVDDNQDAANSLATLLQFKGGDVRVAYDGPSALDILTEQHPDLIILDIGMPGMDGYEVARHIRARPESRQTPLIAMTGWGQDRDRQRSLEAGFDHHLVKPVPLDVLDSLLMGRWIQKQWNVAPTGYPPAGSRPEAARAASPLQRLTALIQRLEQDASDAEQRALLQELKELRLEMAVDPQTSQHRRALRVADGTGRESEAAITPAHWTDDHLVPLAITLIHALAQPLNTIGCYAVAARTLATKSSANAGRLNDALRGIDEQIQRAGTALEHLRALFSHDGVSGNAMRYDQDQAD